MTLSLFRKNPVKRRFFNQGSFITFLVLMALMSVASVSLAQDNKATKSDTGDGTAALKKTSVNVAEAGSNKEEPQFEAAMAKAKELLASPDLPIGTKTVTLKEALQLTLERNLTLRQIKVELEKADAKLGQARGLLMPIVQAEAQYVMADHNSEVDFGGASVEISPKHTATGVLTATVPLVDLSKWKSVQLAEEGTNIAALSFKEAKQNILYGTAKAYYSALLSQALVELFQEQITATQMHLRVAEEKFLAGSGLRIDVLRAGIDFEQAGEELLDARLSLASACDALGVLTGVRGMVAPKTRKPLPAIDTVEDQTLVETAYRERIDVLVAKTNAQLTDDQVKSTAASLYPALNLTWQGTSHFTEPSGMGDSDRLRWNLILGLAVPVFNYNTYATIREKKAAKKQAALDIDVLTRDVEQEVRLAHREYKTALMNVSGATRRVKLGKESLKLAESAYSVGAGTSLEVSDARRDYLQAEVDLATTQLRTQLSLIELFRSIGRNPENFIN